jgi:plasmid stabilization system protein ParE
LSQLLAIRVARRAAADIDEATDWWELNRAAAPGAIADEIERAFALIRSQPRIGALARNARLPGVRRVHLSRVHYHLYYRVMPEAIEVLAFWHTSRGSVPSV